MKHIKKLISAVLSRITPTLKQIHTVKFKREGEHPAERRESTVVRSNETRIPLLSFRTRSLRTTHFSCAAVSRYPKLAAPRILQRASAAAGPNFSWKHFGAQSKKEFESSLSEVFGVWRIDFLRCWFQIVGFSTVNVKKLLAQANWPSEKLRES